MRKPSGLFVVCLSVMVLLGVVGYVAWYRAQVAPAEVRLKDGFISAVFYRKTKIKSVTEVERLRMKAEQAEVVRVLLEKFPILRIEGKPVPDEENGYLQIIRFGKTDGRLIPEANAMKALSACMTKWDAEKARAFLADYPLFLAEATRIAELPNHSSVLPSVDHMETFSLSKVMYLQDVFLLQARLAAETGDEAAALEAMKHAVQLRNHIHGLDVVTVMAETTVICSDRRRMQWMMEFMLPRIGPKADLKQWSAFIMTEPNAPKRLAHVLRGEWNDQIEYFFLPTAIRARHDGTMPEAVEVAYFNTAQYVKWIEELERKPAIGFSNMCVSSESYVPNYLTENGRRFVYFGLDSYGSAYCRPVVMCALYHAAMQCLIHEKMGVAMPEFLDPVSGLPMRYDAASRTISAPDWNGAPKDIQPVKLPW